MSVYLIRHGLTQGNLEGRYIGCRTDEALCGQGIKRLEELRMPKVRQVFISPMKRCIQTARILFPGAERIVVPDFRECDFGDFEGKNYTELNGDPAYQAWIDSGGELAFPGGESRKRFAQRCVNAFAKLDLLASDEDCAVVAHGGTVMAIMEEYARPRGGYFDFQVKCGEGYVMDSDGNYQKLS
ncbi:MAG: histidine phosphatase family protein [Clostridia bacterium]|nr:histidine phosphatase family protein [Clostridia bacterium]